MPVKDQEGQALFEFIVFLPIMLILFAISVTLVNSINASINQQKIVRGYFFNLIHNDSSMISMRLLNLYQNDGIKQASMITNGWREEDLNTEPRAPCFKMLTLSDKIKDEECSPGMRENEATRFIRPKTVFGLCAETFGNFNGNYVKSYYDPFMSIPASDYASCLNTM